MPGTDRRRIPHRAFETHRRSDTGVRGREGIRRPNRGREYRPARHFDRNADISENGSVRWRVSRDTGRRDGWCTRCRNAPDRELRLAVGAAPGRAGQDAVRQHLQPRLHRRPADRLGCGPRVSAVSLVQMTPGIVPAARPGRRWHGPTRPSSCGGSAGAAPDRPPQRWLRGYVHLIRDHGAGGELPVPEGRPRRHRRHHRPHARAVARRDPAQVRADGHLRRAGPARPPRPRRQAAGRLPQRRPHPRAGDW